MPTVDFCYSFVYDQNISTWYCKAKNIARKKFTVSPKAYLEEIQDMWWQKETLVFDSIAHALQLQWQKNLVSCYLVSYGTCFSDPLTMRRFKDRSRFLHVLTHELVHVLLLQNQNIVTAAQQYFKQIYSNESQLTRNHIVVHAVLAKILPSCFGKAALDRDIELCQKSPEYKRAWDIVLEKGSDTVLAEYIAHYRA